MSMHMSMCMCIHMSTHVARCVHQRASALYSYGPVRCLHQPHFSFPTVALITHLHTCLHTCQHVDMCADMCVDMCMKYLCWDDVDMCVSMCAHKCKCWEDMCPCVWTSACTRPDMQPISYGNILVMARSAMHIRYGAYGRVRARDRTCTEPATHSHRHAHTDRHIQP